MRSFSPNNVARVLIKLCEKQTIADLINATLSAEQEATLDDEEVEIAAAIFDELCDQCPEAVDIAQGLTEPE